MQVKRTETADKPKGMIERNQSVNKLNSDTLENKVDASLKHTAESGLKTSGSSITEGADGKSRYAAAQRARLANDDTVASKPKQAGYDEYYKRQLEDSSEESAPKQEFSARKSEQSTIHTKSSNSASDTVREQFLHNKQINSSDDKSRTRKNKNADITEYEVKGDDKSVALYQRDLDRKTRKLLGKGEVEEKPKSRIKTGQEKSVPDRADALKSDHDTVKKFKYYRSTNGQIQTKVEYNRRLLKKVEPKGLSKLSFHELNNQRRIKSANNEAIRAFDKEHEAWENYKNDPNAQNAKLYRRAHDNYIGVLKKRYSADELASGNFVEFGNKKIRVLTKVNFEGNIDDVKKTIKLDKKSYRKLRTHLRFKKLSNASASVLGKMINLSAVSLPKATLRSGLNYINTKAKSVNTEDTSDTGIEASKYIYKTASEGKHLATSVKSGIQTSAKAAKATYKTVREIPGMVKNIPHTARKIATSVRTAPHTAKNAVNKTAKKAAQNVRKAAKQAQKAAQKTVETAKKAAQAAEKVAEVTFKAMAKATAFFVTHLPIILIVSLVLIVVFLVAAVVSGMTSAVTNIIVGGVGYVIPGVEESTPEQIAGILDNYQETINYHFSMWKEIQIDAANRFLTASDDYYAVNTDRDSKEWIPYTAEGEETVRNDLADIEIDYAEYYALLYVYAQRQKNNSDGDSSNDIYSFTFSEAMLSNFLGLYFDLEYVEIENVECPLRNCQVEFCDGCKTGTGTRTVTDAYGNTHEETYTYTYCPGHYYCDKHHKKARISITKNLDVMDELGFSSEERQWKDLIEKLYDEYIMGYILNKGGETD
ncbi:hypothetical protein [Ruminococcus sp.]|uniref:hypothetical protein n=1 Tax=Ruminococcus sp. TaxID=41978 RepID=UPI0025F046BE|nr:hypothetical protein [Ruminococcus sp.]MBR1433236.1 hypothetical protein [Ruminococcus sp.]